MTNASQVVVLAEDGRHQQFVRKYLDRLGYRVRNIRFEPLPAGSGSGEKFVRENYARAVKEYRARSAKAQSARVVVIDADADAVEHRQRQLRERLTVSGMKPREDGDRIAQWIPRRAIETWVLCLAGMQVNEDADYRHDAAVDAMSVTAAAERFHAWTRRGFELPPHCVPSLRAAIPEARRIEE